MHGQGTLEIALVFLLAAVVAVPLFRRAGLPDILSTSVVPAAVVEHFFTGFCFDRCQAELHLIVRRDLDHASTGGFRRGGRGSRRNRRGRSGGGGCSRGRGRTRRGCGGRGSDGIGDGRRSVFFLAATETEERSKKCKGKESEFHVADNVVSPIATCKPEA